MTEIFRPPDLGNQAWASRIRAEIYARRGFIVGVLVLALAAWMSFNWVQTVERIARYYTPLATWDYWRPASFVRAYQAFQFRVLWTPHNEHRIVFPEIVFASDYLLFHGRRLLPLILSFACYAGNWLVLAWAFGSITELPRTVRAMAVLLAGVILGWQGSAALLADPFLLQWTLMEVAVLLSFAFLARFAETASYFYLAGLICCAELATYSSANALLLWPLLVLLAAIASVRGRQLLIITLAGLVSIGIYFIGYPFQGNLSILQMLLHPLYTLGFVAVYLSMPFSELKSPNFGVWLGICALAIVILLGCVAFRRRVAGSRAAIVLFGCYAFAVLTALLTAAGRMKVHDWQFGDAKPARYLTSPLTAWGVFVLLCLWLCSRSYQRLAPRLAIVCIVSVLLAIAFPKFRWWFNGQNNNYAEQEMAALSLQMELEDPSMMLNIFLDPPSVLRWMSTLRENHLSVFYKSRRKWLGEPREHFANLVDTEGRGEITYTYPVVGGTEVGGWFDESGMHGGTGWVLLANENGKIAGFGRKLPAGFPWVLNNQRTPPKLGWVGFVNSKYASKSFFAYVINKRGLTSLPGPVPIGEITATPWRKERKQVEGVAWQMEGDWSLGSLPKTIYFGPGPSSFYSSWKDELSNRGRLTSSVFSAPRNSCLILPVLQGDSAHGLALKIIDVDNGQVSAEVPFQNFPKEWICWRFPLQPSVKRLQIVAVDQGDGLGEWLAVGNPLLCE